MTSSSPPSPSSSPPPLPLENVFGHRKKLDFLREGIRQYVQGHAGKRVRVLDVGCSNGQHVTVHLGDLGAEVLAIDPHEESIRYAVEHNPWPDTIAFKAARIEELPGEDRFDVVVLSDVLEHLHDPGAVLNKARERLVEGGIILGSIPNGYGPFEIESALDKRGCLTPSYLLFRAMSSLKGLLTGRGRAQAGEEDAVPYAGECGHVQFWTLCGFRSLLNEHGLAIADWRKGPWLGALCTSTWWGRSLRFCRWNATMGDHLPSWCVSTWYFRIEKTPPSTP